MSFRFNFQDKFNVAFHVRDVLAACAGALWGLALARVLAETLVASPTFERGPTLALALVSAGVATAINRRGIRTFTPLFLSVLYLFWPYVAPPVGWTLLVGSLVLMLLLHLTGTLRIAGLTYSRFVALLLMSVTSIMYLFTLGPTVGEADTFEFQVVAPTLGIAHPTGYPLYILLGKLFSLLPFGSVAWRVNLTSAVFATGAVLVLYRMITRLNQSPAFKDTTVRRLVTLAAAVAALALAFSPIFWSQAVVAEVYALHNLFVALIIGLLAYWLTTPQSARSRDGDALYLYGLALLMGLSLTNHLTTVLLVPGIALALWFVRPKIRWSTYVTAGLLFLLGLSFYLYIYFRWPALHDGVWMSLSDFVRYVTGQQFGGALRTDAWLTDSTRYAIVGRLLRDAFDWPGLFLSVLGLIRLALKHWRVGLVTLLTFLAYVWYALGYYVPDISVFLLPAHVLLATWMGVGIGAVVVTARNRVGASGLVLAMCVLLPLQLLWSNWAGVDQSDERALYRWGERILDLPLHEDGAILADGVHIAPLYYLQRIQGRRPDMDLVVLADEDLYRAELDARIARGQTVYLARFLPGLEGIYHLRSVGPLTEVSRTPLKQPSALDQSLATRWRNGGDESVGLELLGLDGPVVGPAGGLGLDLYWRTAAPIPEVYHVHLRLVDPDGQIWWQSEGRHAVDNYYPTPAWRPGEVIVDYHEIRIDQPLLLGLPQTQYTVQVGLFRPFSDEGLLTEEGEVWVPLLHLDAETLRQAPGGGEPPHRLQARFGDGLFLQGVDVPAVTTVGAPVELTLYWHAGSDLAHTRPRLTWRQKDGVAKGGDTVEAVRLTNLGNTRLSLPTPPVPGTYFLSLQLWDSQQHTLEAHCGWLAQARDACVLATTQVQDATDSALANFDGRMLLLDAQVGAEMLQPGQQVPVTLHWQALQGMQKDYTVSVQLVGPAGRLHGQVDAWPVQGTRPTSQWTAGQRILDPYSVPLAEDAPAGRYRLGVVVYLLETRTRLPVVDVSGRAMGDVGWIGELNVMAGGE